MRPSILFSVFKSVTTIKGVGPRMTKLIETIAGSNIIDLLFHLPNEIVDRRYFPKIASAQSGLVATIIMKIDNHYPPHNRRLPYKIKCSDDTGSISLVFFHSHSDYLLKQLPIGSIKVVSGKVEKFGDQIQITHPDYIEPFDQLKNIKMLEPVYRLTAGLTNKSLGKIISRATDEAPSLKEWIDPQLKVFEGWPSWNDAISSVHRPSSVKELNPLCLARSRLAYDEFLANQVALEIIRRDMRVISGNSYFCSGQLYKKALSSLPFNLTRSQKTALKQIKNDMASDLRMLRLLQGDVGSGKTIVAFLALLDAVECNFQAAIMAPTAILAQQHFDTLLALANRIGIKILLLTGSDRGKSRQDKLERIASAKVEIVIGTHALFQKDIDFKKLGIVIIDEQHRFGVDQRLDFSSKGKAADILVMSATPIPRTLMLAAYGDMDVSFLYEKPEGRRKVDTRTIPVKRLGEVVEAIGRSIRSGGKVFWICPLVEDKKPGDASAEGRFDYLNKHFLNQTGLVHGRLKSADKDNIMKKFSEGEVKILVATTVVEVGVDISDASVIVIDHAERFGLSQLHQLRGRVGRGQKDSACLLLYSSPLSETARARLSVMRETNDGFKIAEKDLKLRGSGELLGTRQSGIPQFRLADLTLHKRLLTLASKDAKNLLRSDPNLISARGQAIRNLLYLFNQDAIILNMRSG